MSKIKVHDWEVWQTFRKDRGTPPWIKIHRSLLSNKKWATLSDAEKGQLVSMWMVAADDDGQLPNDAAVIRKICQLDEKPDLIKFKELGFLTQSCQPTDNHLPTTCQPLAIPSDAPETEERQSREEKKEDNAANEKKYAFAGNHIKLNQRDFDQWKESYQHIPDWKAELTALDDHLHDKPDKQKGWFSYISAILKKRNQDYARNPPLKAEHKPKAQTILPGKKHEPYFTYDPDAPCITEQFKQCTP